MISNQFFFQNVKVNFLRFCRCDDDGLKHANDFSNQVEKHFLKECALLITFGSEC